MPSGTVAVPSGSASVVIAATLPAAYQITLTPYWNANGPFVDLSTKTAAGFTAVFPSPPFVDTFLDWTATPSGATPVIGGITLGSYLDELNDVLHATATGTSYWTTAQKIKYINRAIAHRDLETGANRVVQPVTLVIGQDTYEFSVLGNPSVFDVVSINLLYNTQRLVLDQCSWTDLNALPRSWTLYREVPRAFARYGQTKVVFAPAPWLAYETEWDTCVVTGPLVNVGDVDTQPYPYTLPVVYYAAYLAKLNERQYAEADIFLKLYRGEMSSAQDSRVGMVPSAYPSSLAMR